MNIEAMLGEMADAFDAFKANYAAKQTALEKQLADERKEREALEIKINRTGLGRGSADIPAGDFRAETKALSTWLRNEKEGGAELKAMSVGSDPGGGYIVLPAMSTQMTKKLFDQSAVRRLARVISVNTDAWEEILDANDVEANWTGEVSPRPATATADLGKFRVDVKEIYANQPITQNLIDDAVFDVGAWSVNKVGDKFGRTEGAAFVSGDGVARPRGFLTYPTATTGDATRAQGTLQYIATGVDGDFAASAKGDKLIDLVYAVRAPYKQGDKVAWLMNSTTAGSVRKFKDGQNNYLWQDSIQKGQPAMLLGFPVEIDENMPDVGSGTFPIAFGNWELAYTIVDRQGIKMLTDPYTNKPFVMFYTTKRVGGGLANSEAVKLLKCSTS